MKALELIIWSGIGARTGHFARYVPDTCGRGEIFNFSVIEIKLARISQIPIIPVSRICINDMYSGFLISWDFVGFRLRPLCSMTCCLGKAWVELQLSDNLWYIRATAGLFSNHIEQNL